MGARQWIGDKWGRFVAWVKQIPPHQWLLIAIGAATLIIIYLTWRKSNTDTQGNGSSTAAGLGNLPTDSGSSGVDTSNAITPAIPIQPPTFIFPPVVSGTGNGIIPVSLFHPGEQAVHPPTVITGPSAPSAPAEVAVHPLVAAVTALFNPGEPAVQPMTAGQAAVRPINTGEPAIQPTVISSPVIAAPVIPYNYSAPAQPVVHPVSAPAQPVVHPLAGLAPLLPTTKVPNPTPTGHGTNIAY